MIGLTDGTRIRNDRGHIPALYQLSYGQIGCGVLVTP